MEECNVLVLVTLCTIVYLEGRLLFHFFCANKHVIPAINVNLISNKYQDFEFIYEKNPDLLR